MKTKIFIVLIGTLVLILSACVKMGDEPKNDVTDDYAASISALEEKISVMLSEQSKENKLEMEKLRAEIVLMNNGEETGIDTSTTNDKTESTTEEKVETSETKGSKFLYEVIDGKATITGYTGNESYIVIPSFIDGYQVESVGENAFCSSEITTVVISEGVKNVDWFAFYTCPRLSAVTIPSSVTSIGYSAFDGASPSFTVYCQRNSYAYEYAKSYGLTCVVV